MIASYFLKNFIFLILSSTPLFAFIKDKEEKRKVAYDCLFVVGVITFLSTLIFFYDSIIDVSLN